MTKAWLPPRRVTARFLGALLLLAGLLAAGPEARAQGLLAMDEPLTEVRGWDIGVNTKAAGCLAKAKYEDQTTVWFGFADGGKSFFGLSNPRWRSIEAGKSYKIQMLARGGGRWHGNFTGAESEAGKSLVGTDLKDSFMVDLARAGGLDVRYEGKSITRLSLSGSMAALEAVIDCQKDLIAYLKREGREPAQARSTPKDDPKGEGTSSGTGFFVSASGHVLTNHHVIDGCKMVEITRQGAVSEPVQVIARDATNDLALLKAVNGPAGPVPALAPRTRIGDSIYIYGFPLAGILASSGNFTVGNVTATSGLNDDSRMLQISAPVQPGNSGGPLMDQHGNIAGVVVSKLNALRLASVTKDLAQNVNFAIKSSVAQTFLDGNAVTPALGPADAATLDPATIAERAKLFTVFVVCR
ncbi:serine protease [Xanthobacter sp. V2C-8]|uniref:S1C family serine protease n=1 Tax=Xanthobacter albus TaxID=3119929 RepID=UPI00372956B6